MSTALDEFTEAFSKLKSEVDPSYWPASTLGRAPQKPLLLLAVLDGVAAGSIPENEVRLTPALRERFGLYWVALSMGKEVADPSTPFKHLESDGFWALVGNGESGASAAHLDATLFGLIIEPAARRQLRQVLIDYYFSEEVRPSLTELSLEDGADEDSAPGGRRLAPLFDRILQEFRQTAPGVPWGGGHPLWSIFKDVAVAIEQLPQ